MAPKATAIEDYYFSPDPARSEEPVVWRLAVERFAAHYHLRRRERPNCVILYVRRGHGTYRGDRGTRELGPGMIFTFAPGHLHEVRCDPNDPLEVQRVVFIGPFAAEQLRGHLGYWCHAWRIPNAAEISDIIDRMLRLAGDGGAFVQESCNHYLQILLMAIHRGLTRELPHSSRAQTTFLAAREIMDREFATGITVADVAVKVGVSYEHLSRVFRKHQGSSPAGYVQRLRMNKATELLCDSGFSVSAAALEVGYRDLYTFSKAFKRFHGLSPSAYTQKWGGTAPG